MSHYAIPDPRHAPRRRSSSAPRPPLAGASPKKAQGEMSLAVPIALPLMAKSAENLDVREGAPETLFAEATRAIRQQFADFVIGTDTALGEKLQSQADEQGLLLADYVAAIAWRSCSSGGRGE